MPIMIIMAQNLGMIETNARLLSKNPPEKEIIHSGHFMVSNFEAEAQDDEDVFVSNTTAAVVAKPETLPSDTITSTSNTSGLAVLHRTNYSVQSISIETSLTKLFQCMSLAYRQKLTSPKWNRFKGIRLRWKDKIRLNNVIWRCWHMQFITKKNALVCQFASPLDTDTHNKPEAIVLEGKYWKRKLNAVTAEYKKWRQFYRNRLLGWGSRDGQDSQDMLSELDMLDLQTDNNMLVDEDYMEFMTDTLFSTISANQPFAFPDTREIARGAGLADLIQPSLVQLQPNLDDFMDTFEPLQELFYSKLPPVPEESHSSDDLYRSLSSGSTVFHSEVKRDMPSQYQMPSPTTQYSPASKPRPTYPSYMQHYQQLSPPTPLRTSPSPPHQEFILPGPPPPLTPIHNRAPARSNSLPVTGTPSSKREEDTFLVPKLKGVNRSRSLCCQTSASEPQLQISTQHTSALLAQLLTNSTSCQGSTSPVTAYSSNEPAYHKSPDGTMQRTVIYSPHKDNSSLNLSANRKAGDSPIPTIYDTPYNFTAVSRNMPHTSSLLVSPTSQPSTSQVAVSSASNSPKHPDSPGNSDSLSLSPLNVGSPHSPGHTSTVGIYKEHRRVSHINAEQKRRCNIKNGFDTLHSLIPQLSQNPNAKLSKAAMLQKGAEYIRQLRSDRQSLKDEIEGLRQQVDSLNLAISNCQSLLPATGAPVSRHRSNKMKEMFDEYVRARTQENWKFWLMSLVCEPLLHSFSAHVSSQSLDEFYNTILNWVDQHCTLSVLRPLALNALRQLCKTTEVLSDPARLPSEVREAASRSRRHSAS